ncbi:MAG: carboxylating nicotinate-nucleotide diphosphorylase [Planctomycetes bacterium]|nr:carboxylating nicotinate-nucleotide diphosphorylase [Planctomycetota bacterium]
MEGRNNHAVSLVDDESLLTLIHLAKAEDLGHGDVTSALFSRPDEPAVFRLRAKQRGVFAGVEIAHAVLYAYDPSTRLTWLPGVADGMALDAVPRDVAELGGPVASILAAERVLLNFLQRLSGIATLTRRFVEAVSGTQARIYDTRKTTPGWRLLEKYAVRCGGGCNHRMGLFDAVLVKDNHVAGGERRRLAPAVFEMLNRLGGTAARPAFVEVEAQSVDELRELLKVVGVDLVLLDNFSPDELRAAVELRDGAGLRGKVELEASGGITQENVRAVAATGVERISVGAITHSATALDLSLERVAC